MDDEKIRKIFEEENIADGITCPEAFEISEKYGISKIEIARFCNASKIKIRACQLGCFK